MKYIINYYNFKNKIPDDVIEIQFSDDFNELIDDIVFPNLIQEISFGFTFNQSLEHVILPEKLQKISFGMAFNQPIDKINFHNSLLKIDFDSLTYVIDNLPPTINEIYIYSDPVNCYYISKSKLPFGCKITYK